MSKAGPNKKQKLEIAKKPKRTYHSQGSPEWKQEADLFSSWRHELRQEFPIPENEDIHTMLSERAYQRMRLFAKRYMDWQLDTFDYEGDTHPFPNTWYNYSSEYRQYASTIRDYLNKIIGMIIRQEWAELELEIPFFNEHINNFEQAECSFYHDLQKLEQCIKDKNEVGALIELADIHKSLNVVERYNMHIFCCFDDHKHKECLCPSYKDREYHSWEKGYLGPCHCSTCEPKPLDPVESK